MKTPLKTYLDALASALAPHFAPDQCYFGKDGALRLAREVGFGLADYQDLEINKVIPELYSRLLVIHCFSKSGVPISNKQFVSTIRSAIIARREKRVSKLSI